MAVKRNWDFKDITSESIKKYEGLIEHVLGKYDYRDDYEEIIGEGYIWLCRAIQTYKKDKGPMVAWIVHYLAWSFIRYVKHEQRLKRDPKANGYTLSSLDTVAGEDGDLSPKDLIVDEAAVVFDFDKEEVTRLNTEFIDGIESSLSKRVASLWLSGMTYETIGEQCDISKQAVHQRLQKELHAFKRRLNARGVLA